MASKTTLNARNLETLGAAVLAELLIDISKGSAAAKRRLRLALAGGLGAQEAAAQIRKRLITVGRSRSFINWKNRKTLVTDLQAQLDGITTQVAPSDSAEAADLLWRFLDLANGLLDRCDDSSGTVGALFEAATARLGRLAAEAGLSPALLVPPMVAALFDNGHGQYDGLIPALAPALGPDGLALLKAQIDRIAAAPLQIPPRDEWQVVGMGLRGPVHAHEIAEASRLRSADAALRQIADAQGDADGFMARHAPETRRDPAIAAAIAQRLLAADRAAEALELLDRAEIDPARWIPPEWQDSRISALEALGQPEAAQAFRWACFARSLSIPHLRDHLKRLPDFDDIEAEDRAMALAAAFAHPVLALSFLVNWPAPARAAALVLARCHELDGEHYEILTAAADSLAENHPLAATLLLRAMIDFALTKARAGRYAHAARHFRTCAELDSRIADPAGFERHAAYAARLRAQHGRKSAFWADVG